MSDQLKYFLEESKMPKSWYNISADLPKPMEPPLHHLQRNRKVRRREDLSERQESEKEHRGGFTHQNHTHEQATSNWKKVQLKLRERRRNR